MQSRRVVVTGIGTVNPIGRNVPEFLESLDKGVSGAKLITRFDASLFKTRFACEISDFDLQSYGFNRKEGAKIDRYSQFALAAAREAVADAIDDWSRIDKDRVGVIVGSGVGGLESFANETRGCIVGETPRYSPFIIPKILTNMASGHISIHYGFRGPNFAVTSACSTSASAICSAAMIIQTGRADMVVAGGSEAPIEHSGVGGFGAMRAISVNNEEYQTASRPFDKTRDGFVMAEGAGILVLEDYEHAVNRGAKIYAEIIGYGMTGDAYHFAAPCPDGAGAAAAMREALRDAGISPSEVDYINAHGTSTPQGDIAEVTAIKEVFGEAAYKLNISSTKSMTGHLLGAAGAVEAIASIHAIRDGIIPPTINFRQEDEAIDYRLNFTFNQPQRREVNVALSNSFGFGGHNACILFRKV